MPAFSQARIPPLGGAVQFAPKNSPSSLSIGNAGSSVAAALSTSTGVTKVNAVGNADITVSGSPITGIGTLLFGLSTTGVLPGTYSRVVVDTRGRVTAGGPLTTAMRRVTAGSGPVILAGTDDTVVIALNPATACMAQLPADPVNGQQHTIKDRMGAAAQNITISAVDGKNIDGSITLVFNQNNQSGTFMFDATGNEWVVLA